MASPASTTTTIGRLEGTVSPPCAHPGTKVTLTITGAQPKAYVIFDTVYSDGTDHASSHYPTGWGKGQADGTGTFRTSWVLAATVPTGRATINMASSDGRGFHEGQAGFTIEPATQACP